MQVSLQLSRALSSKSIHIWLPFTQEIQNDYRLESALSQVSRQVLTHHIEHKEYVKCPKDNSRHTPIFNSGVKL